MQNFPSLALGAEGGVLMLPFEVSGKQQVKLREKSLVLERTVLALGSVTC